MVEFDRNDLPDELWFKVFSYLDFKTVAKLSIISKRLYEVANSDVIWKAYCKQLWLVEQLPEKYKIWRRYFDAIYANLGRYSDCYKDIKLVWEKIFSILSNKHPHLLSSLKPGISEKRLDIIEKRLGNKLPNDLRCSYRICDGQYETFPTGLFGVSKLGRRAHPFSLSFGDFLVSLGSKGIFNILYEIRKVKSHEHTPDLFVVACPRLENGRFDFYEQFFGVVLNDNKKNCENQAPEGSICLFGRGFFKWDCFIYAKSFREFLQKYADDLENYMVQNIRLLRCEYFGCEILSPIKVQMLVTFDALSRDGNVWYTYAIICTLHESVDPEEAYLLLEQALEVRNSEHEVIQHAPRRFLGPVNNCLRGQCPSLNFSGSIRVPLSEFFVEGRLKFKVQSTGHKIEVLTPVVQVQKPERVVFKTRTEPEFAFLPNVVNIPPGMGQIFQHMLNN